MLEKPVAEGEHQHEGMFHHGLGAITCHVGDGDSQFLRGLQIHAIGPRRRDTDQLERFKPLRRVEARRRHLLVITAAASLARPDDLIFHRIVRELDTALFF